MIAKSDDPMLDLLLARLAERVGDLAQHINRERVAAFLTLVRWAAQREDHIGVTPADRREVAQAVQRLNEIVFDGPPSCWSIISSASTAKQAWPCRPAGRLAAFCRTCPSRWSNSTSSC